MEVANNIILYIKDYFKKNELNGILLMSGGFSRKEISIVNDVLISDMETLFIYNSKKDVRLLKQNLSNLEHSLKKHFKIIPDFFEIEIDCISHASLFQNHKNLPVHQFETLKTNEVLFYNSSKDISKLNIKASLKSIYDIFFHRILNQISLAFNFQNKQLNDVFFNRSIKNLSDAITYNYLLGYNKDIWIITKKERLSFLLKSKLMKAINPEVFDLKYAIKMDDKVFFDNWKKNMLFWCKDYYKRSENCLKTLSIVKSKKTKIYNALIIIYLRLRNSKKLNQISVIKAFEESLIKSESMNELNDSLILELKSLGYSKRNYPFLNASFFIYWLKDINYYKSLK